MHYLFKLLSFLMIFTAIQAGIPQNAEILLSNLEADAQTPVYTPYAAAMDRSEFTLDQGYHFLYYDSSRGADFITDTGGDLCIAFKRGPEYVYELPTLHRRPVITVNYPDMVRYHYFPFPEIRVDATFLVYSSTAAILDLKLSNVSEASQDFELIPFIQNTYRVFNDVEMHPDNKSISFTHEELPDRWVLSHNIPYVTPVQDLFISSQKPDRLTSYRSYRWGNIPIPQEVHIDKPPVYVVWIRISNPLR